MGGGFAFCIGDFAQVVVIVIGVGCCFVIRVSYLGEIVVIVINVGSDPS